MDSSYFHSSLFTVQVERGSSIRHYSEQLSKFFQTSPLPVFISRHFSFCFRLQAFQYIPYNISIITILKCRHTRTCARAPLNRKFKIFFMLYYQDLELQANISEDRPAFTIHIRHSLSTARKSSSLPFASFCSCL